MMLLSDSLKRSGGCLSEDNLFNARHVENADQIYHGKPFPTPLYAALSDLWDDPGIQAAWEQSNRPRYAYYSSLLLYFSNRSLLNFSSPYFYTSLDRFFSPDYVPTYKDITQVASANGEMPETIFKLPDTEMTIIDAGLCKEPPELSDVTCILSVINLAGYDIILRRAVCFSSPSHG
jgi:guanine nucleotide-binding protein subunit alpha